MKDIHKGILFLFMFHNFFFHKRFVPNFANH